jgi:sugar lactone lactonase YvrE
VAELPNSGGGGLREGFRLGVFKRAIAVFMAVGSILAVALPASAAETQSPAPTFEVLDFPTNDLAFDPISQKIYASVPGWAGTLGNRVVAIDPATGAVTGSVFVGSEPTKLALSADGTYLYVALSGAAAVRRVELASLTAGLQFSLGSNWFSGPYLVDDMAVLPSDSGAVAVARRNDGFSPRHEGVAVYDEGVKVGTETPSHTGSNVIEFGSSPTRLYGYNNETTEFGFRRMTVGSAGVSIDDVTSNLISNFSVDIEFDGGRIYTTTGRVIDPEARTLLGTFQLGGTGPVEADTARGKVHFVVSGRLDVYDAATFTPLASTTIPGVSGSAASLIEIGGGNLAFRTTGDQVYLVRFPTAADTTPPVVTVPDDMIVAADAANGAAVTYTASAVDDSDGGLPASCNPGSGSVFPVGTTIVVCTASDAAGNSGAATFRVTVRSPGPAVSQVALPANDLVYDRFSQRIYASVPSRAGSLGNRVVAIDPATGAVVASVFVGSEPAKLALSADSRYLYVALNGAAAVRRVDLPSFTAGLQFSLGADPFFGPYYVEDMEVLPTDPGAVAISRRYTGVSPRHAGVAVYDEGVKLGGETPGHTGSNVIEFGSSSRLYGYNNESTEFGFRRLTVSASGVAEDDATQNLVSGFSLDMEFDAGRIYTTSGYVVDPEARLRLGRFPLVVPQPVQPDSTNGKVSFVDSGSLAEFDATSFTLRNTYALPGLAGTPASLIGIGGGSLAFRTSADQIFILRFPTPDTTPPVVTVPADMTVDATGPAGAAVSYAASAVDGTDGQLPVACSPASGTTFAIGTTTVVCAATDRAGNTGTASFKATVRGANEQIASLRTKVNTLADKKLRQSLDAKLRDASSALSTGKKTRACSMLGTFIGEVQANSGAKIPAATATAWIADATRIRAVVGC